MKHHERLKKGLSPPIFSGQLAETVPFRGGHLEPRKSPLTIVVSPPCRLAA